MSCKKLKLSSNGKAVSWSLLTANGSPCNWTGITRDGDKKVAKIDLLDYNLGGVSFLLCTSVVIFFILHGRKKNVKNEAQEVHKDLFSIWTYDGKIIYEDIIEATERFDDKFYIREGGYGRVYKADLLTGQVVAVKKLNHTKMVSKLIKQVSEMRYKH